MGKPNFPAIVKDTSSETPCTPLAKGGAGVTTERGGEGTKHPLAFECVITINTGIESGVIILTPLLDEAIKVPPEVEGRGEDHIESKSDDDVAHDKATDTDPNEPKLPTVRFYSFDNTAIAESSKGIKAD